MQHMRESTGELRCQKSCEAAPQHPYQGPGKAGADEAAQQQVGGDEEREATPHPAVVREHAEALQHNLHEATDRTTGCI